MTDANIATRKPLRFLSLGAGVQSTTLLLMMLHDVIEPADHVIFADTGWEPKAVYEHLHRLKQLMSQANMPFHVVSIGNIRQDTLTPNKRVASMPLFMLSSEGKKGMVRRQCTKGYKIEPLLRKQRELVGLAKGERNKHHLATTIIGISFDESERMRDASFPWLRNDYPLIDRRMTRQDCVDWCLSHGYETPPRSACIGCPFKSDDEWRRLRQETPDEFADAVDFDRQLRNLNNPLSNAITSIPYLHRARIPLDQVDLRNASELGQDSLFDQECQGMCGV